MDERNYGYSEPTNFEPAQAPEAPVEDNASAPAPATEQPAKEQKRGPKDFTPEEVKTILARAAKVDLSRVAKEYNTSWQAIMSLQKAEKAAKMKAKQKPAVKEKKNAKAVEAPKTIKRSEEFTKKEKEDILERARKFGFREVAAEVGTNWQTLAYWNKHQRLTGSVPTDTNVKPAAKPKVKAAAAAHAPKTEKPAAASTSATSTKPAKTANSEALEIENAILKEKLAILTQQVEKLRAAVGSLA